MTAYRRFRTEDLVDDALDYAVAKSLGYVIEGSSRQFGYIRWRTPKGDVLCFPFIPSRSADQAAPIIERLYLEFGMRLEAVDANYRVGRPKLSPFKATVDGWESVMRGRTVQECALRLQASLVHGSMTDLPEELWGDEKHD